MYVAQSIHQVVATLLQRLLQGCNNLVFSLTELRLHVSEVDCINTDYLHICTVEAQLGM